MENYIAGIFVKGNNKSKGIGKSLLDFIKEKREELNLSVYEKNTRAIEFYKREGFVVVDKNIEEDNDEVEFLMSWSK